MLTAGRTALSVPLLMWCTQEPSWFLLVSGWLVFWIGDLLDGFAARSLDLETRAGALFDSVCDRVSMLWLLLALRAVTDWWSVWSTAFVALFCVIDLLISMSFLRLNLVSPIYFWLIDSPTWALNWHPIAKALSLAPFVLISVVESEKWAGSYCLLYLGVKAFSLGRISLLQPLGSGTHESEETYEHQLAADPIRASLGGAPHPVQGWPASATGSPNPVVAVVGSRLQ